MRSDKKQSTKQIVGGTINWESNSVMKRKIERAVKHFHAAIHRGESRYQSGDDMINVMNRFGYKENTSSVHTFV